MKVIKDEDLLSLHYQIEKAEIKQQKLEELLEENTEKLVNRNRSARIFGFTTLLLAVFVIFLVMNAFFNKPSGEEIESSVAESKELLAIRSELKSLRNELVTLEKDKVDLEVIKELYLYRDLIDKDIVYSVQINSFIEDKISSISEKFINGRVYSDTSFFKLSLGIFETLPEAQQFRKTLMESGFSDRIFVISYKDGKRVRIENPT